MIKTYPTSNILNERQAQSLLAKLIYSIEGISGCRLDETTQAIIVELLPGTAQGPIDDAVERLIAKERSSRIIGSRLYRETEAREDARAGTPETAGELFAPNGAWKRGLAVTLSEQIDRLLVEWAQRHQAQLRSYPSMIPVETLRKCRYIETFPQNIHFVSEFPHRLEELEKVREAGDLNGLARLSPYALSPAVCFHCYAELSGSRLQEPLVLTSRGTCFRHEAAWRVGKHRLQEFSMREIVLFGEASFIEEERRAFMEEAWSLFERLGLAGKIETASDPFFFSEESGKGQQQLMGNMKYELIARAGEDGGSFSIASFNHMGDSLCKPFEVLDAEANPMQSGCIAFGIDRWAYALLDGYGGDYGKWPARVRETLESARMAVPQ
ncbi:amino acid--ACP ligase [Paenibacillus albicereus]|uniref:Amino acid--ACP ligase n=1 Tax=Paenibacillus albicereus TaxID=2726185 RepID=A0A6H2H0N5_9BACL|nr:aminoacyl--tRNA ligase-related protein [Paenibacillus albicereus]QJC53251.1 amino acid--ACP ligase [Paenibacillus albicereus]